MFGVVHFIRGLIYVVFMLGAAGALVEVTGYVGREDAKAQHHGGIKFKRLNQQLIVGGNGAA